MNFAYRLKVQSCQLRSYIVLTVVTGFFAAEFAYSKSYSNNNLPYGHVCVLQHPKGTTAWITAVFHATKKVHIEQKSGRNLGHFGQFLKFQIVKKCI